MRENWQYLTWEVSLGSTNARPNCPKSGGPGRTQVLRHHISQVQGRRAGQEHDGAGRGAVGQSTGCAKCLTISLSGINFSYYSIDYFQCACDF